MKFCKDKKGTICEKNREIEESGDKIKSEQSGETKRRFRFLGFSSVLGFFLRKHTFVYGAF